MNQTMQWYLKHGLARVQADCRAAESRIAREQRVCSVVRFSQISVRTEFRMLARRDVEQVRQAAWRRIDTLLDGPLSEPLSEVYRCLCGHFPDLAVKVRARMQKESAKQQAAT